MTPALPPAVRNVFDAARLGDTDAFVGAFVPHLGVVDDWGRKFHGGEAIRRWSDGEFIGKHATVRVIHFYLTDDAEVVVIAHVAGDGFNGASTFTFRVENDRVAEMRITA